MCTAPVEQAALELARLAEPPAGEEPRVEGPDDPVRTGCLVRAGELSFHDLAEALEKDRRIEELPKKPSLVVLYRKDDAILIEEATPLTAELIRRLETPRPPAAVARELADTHPGLLPAEVRDPMAGFQFAIQTLREQGILVPERQVACASSPSPESKGPPTGNDASLPQ